MSYENVHFARQKYLVSLPISFHSNANLPDHVSSFIIYFYSVSDRHGGSILRHTGHVRSNSQAINEIKSTEIDQAHCEFEF